MTEYTNIQTDMLLGSKSDTTYTPATLTAAYTGNVSGTKICEGFQKLVFDIGYTTGSGETANEFWLKVEFSPDGTNWFQALNDAVSAGTSILTQREFQFVGAAAATLYSLDLPITIQNKYYRVSIKEVGVETNYGTVSIETTLNG